MIKLVGFNSASGNFVPEGSATGEALSWSNRTLRCVTDKDLKDGDYGLAVLEQKLKKSEVCKSLGFDENSTDKVVDDALCKLIDSEIEFTVGRVGKEFKINGFKVVKP